MPVDPGLEMPQVPTLHAATDDPDPLLRASDYYASLIDWDDRGDPLHRLIVPGRNGLPDSGGLDLADESEAPGSIGVQHKYSETARLLVGTCQPGSCRYVLHERRLARTAGHVTGDLRPGFDYIRDHDQITDVVLTGGDPLGLDTGVLRWIVEHLLDIEHVRTVRLVSKIPAFEPRRISGDPELARLAEDVSASGRSLYVTTRFDHPRELTAEAFDAVYALRAAGAMCVNECPISAGVNDDRGVLANLFQRCTDAGCPQYYVFQSRPSMCDPSFILPIVRAFELVEDAKSRVSGLSRRARFCLSHSSGKIEIVGLDPEYIYARYHRPKYAHRARRFLTYHRDDEARWVDDLVAGP
jgi:KamA family protein